MLAKQLADLVKRLESITKAFFEVKHLNATFEIKHLDVNFEIKDMDVHAEVYRQDIPQITASWTCQEDSLNRNIGIFAKKSRSGHFVDFEANIWLDDSTNLKRHWLYKPFGTLWVEPYTGEMLPIAIGLALENILNNIAKVDAKELINISDLRPLS